MALIKKLEAIGDSIRAATGTTDLLTLDDMALGVDAIAEERDEFENQLNNLPLEELEITANGEYLPSEGKVGFSKVSANVEADLSDALPAEALTITGNCTYRFSWDGWNWFIDMFGDKIITKDISSCQSMFYYPQNLKSIPFDINCYTGNVSFESMFNHAESLTDIPKIIGKPSIASYMFANCNNLRELKEESVAGIDWSVIDGATTAYAGNRGNTFDGCYSLRKFPMSFLNHGNPLSTTSYTIYYYLFNYCYSLDEIKELPVLHTNATWTSNSFSNTFRNCRRLKSMTFKTNEDGSPIVINKWKNQSINLSEEIGYTAQSLTVFLRNNHGITADKEVKDDATYQALKNDEDWFTRNINYSRYNRTSAVETINSLPDLSGGAGGNTIKFKGAAGALTDGGAINTMTEEEIAVATAKGWTVSFA